MPCSILGILGDPRYQTGEVSHEPESRLAAALGTRQHAPFLFLAVKTDSKPAQTAESSKGSVIEENIYSAGKWNHRNATPSAKKGGC